MTDAPAIVLDPDGRPWWQLRDRCLPLLAGGDDGDGDGSDGTDDDAGKGGTATATDDDGKGDDGEPEADHKLRGENRSLRQRLRDVERERDTLKSAGQSDAEKATTRADQAEQKVTTLMGQVRDLHLEAALRKAGADVGVTDIAAAMRLIDRDALEWDDETNRPDAKTVRAALVAAVKDFPTLRPGKGSIDAGGGGGGGGDKHQAEDFNTTLRRAAGRA